MLAATVALSYVLILRYQWGALGAGLVRLVVAAARVLLWLAILARFGLLRTAFVPATGTPSFASQPLARSAAASRFLCPSMPASQ